MCRATPRPAPRPPPRTLQHAIQDIRETQLWVIRIATHPPTRRSEGATEANRERGSPCCGTTTDKAGQLGQLGKQGGERWQVRDSGQQLSRGWGSCWRQISQQVLGTVESSAGGGLAAPTAAPALVGSRRGTGNMIDSRPCIPAQCWLVRHTGAAATPAPLVSLLAAGTPSTGCSDSFPNIPGQCWWRPHTGKSLFARVHSSEYLTTRHENFPLILIRAQHHLHTQHTLK